MNKKIARSLIVMTAASSTRDEFSNILELAKKHNIRSVHIQQLEVPREEMNSQVRLANALKYNGVH